MIGSDLLRAADIVAYWAVSRLGERRSDMLLASRLYAAAGDHDSANGMLDMYSRNNTRPLPVVYMKVPT